jgi:hypothetical protein
MFDHKTGWTTPAAYGIEADDYQRLRGIERRLYGDGSTMTADERRDLANLLNLILGRAVPMN